MSQSPDSGETAYELVSGEPLGPLLPDPLPSSVAESLVLQRGLLGTTGIQPRPAREREPRPLPSEAAVGRAAHAVCVGMLIGLSDADGALVEYRGNPADHPLPARSTTVLGPGEIGRDVVLTFEEGDPTRPIILGVIRPPGPVDVSREGVTPSTTATLGVTTDGDRLILTAEREVELRCGKASITLTRTGKVLIRGAYLLSRSSGVNLIKGGSVQIN